MTEERSDPGRAQQRLDKLVSLFELDRLDRDMFLGDPGEGERRLFGGLVAAQAVVAAYRTVEQGSMHSVHAYFLRPGRYDVPIRYVVYRIRDGRTFTTRDVVAYQSGEAIFNLSSSFALPEEGITHQQPMPDVPLPEGLPEWEFVRPDRLPEGMRMEQWWRDNPVEMRACDPWGTDWPDGIPRRRVWMRVRGDFPDDEVMHAALLTYASDRGLIATARMPHNIGRTMGASASLDHALWFHYPPRFDDWLLFTSESPAAHNARALILGQMYNTQGVRVASVAQEGLVRQPRE
ncbi:MAG: acyl-CoA thioesterase II [Dehalococcoidia bacterium]